MGKSKRQSLEDGNDTLDSSQIEDVPKLSYEEQLNYVNPIASPMASKKLAKRLYKLVKSAAEHKTFLRHGLKDVQIALKKGETGLVILAGDVTPVDVMCHLPGLCEERNIPYVYTPSHDDLGLAMGVKRSCVVMMVKENPSYQEAYEDCKARVQAITVSTLF